MHAAPLPVAPGDIVDGKYRIEEVIGVGGMGVVVRATHVQLARAVAIKFLLPQMLRDADTIPRFEREARATARLKNEHIVDVIDVGRLPSGAPFIVMEHLEGVGLDKYLVDNSRLAIDEAVEIMIQVADGVAEAHAKGIIHRDLKPQNVFLTARHGGRVLVKVLDFGISKVSGDTSGALTGTRDVMGSPTYMAPEHLLSTRDVGPGVDVWALGVILYQLLTGAPPFTGETFASLCMAICKHPHVPIAQVRPDVPPWLAAVIEGCLVKEPRSRTPSVDAVATSLRLRGQPHGTVTISERLPAMTPGSGVMALGSARISARPDSSSTPPFAPMSTQSGWGQTQGRREGPSRPASAGIVAAFAIAGAIAGVAIARGTAPPKRSSTAAAQPPSSPVEEIPSASSPHASTSPSASVGPSAGSTTPPRRD